MEAAILLNWLVLVVVVVMVVAVEWKGLRLRDKNGGVKVVAAQKSLGGAQSRWGLPPSAVPISTGANRHSPRENMLQNAAKVAE